MDLIQLIKDKIKVFSQTEYFAGIESVISHIEIAERHLDQGKKGDDYLFNDVIYRTNQAFEGSLKEAYNVLANKTADGKSPNEIEKYLELNNLLKERVLTLFSNYRKDWRNKSTHDHKLYFSEQEAFLAIVNICAFFNILLDQMIEKIAYDQEKQKTEQSPIHRPKSYKTMEFSNQIVQLLIDFAEQIPSSIMGSTQPRLLESEVVGMLSGYLNAVDREIEVFTEYSIPLGPEKARMIADFLLKKGEQKIIVELKITSINVARRRRDGREQLFSYMTAANIQSGILFIPPISSSQAMAIERVTRAVGNRKQSIFEIYPKDNAQQTHPADAE